MTLTPEEIKELYKFLSRQYISPDNDSTTYHLVLKLRRAVNELS